MRRERSVYGLDFYALGLSSLGRVYFRNADGTVARRDGNYRYYGRDSISYRTYGEMIVRDRLIVCDTSDA